MDMAKERISLIFELIIKFLSFQSGRSRVIADIVWADLESNSGLDPLSDKIAPRYLKLCTGSGYSP